MPGSRVFDADGVKTRECDIVADGVLQTYLLGVYSARRLGMKTTGNACGPLNVQVGDHGLDKKALLKAIHSKLKKSSNLYIADLMRPESAFERESQLQLCSQLGLTEAGTERMRHNLEHEFYPLDRIRFAELMNETRFSTPKQYFKVLGFAGYVVGS